MNAAAPSRPRVAVVLVTYYGDAHLDRLWTSLAALEYPADRWSLLVVENGSSRLAARWFAAHAPAVRVLVPGDNTGYAGGNALGMAEALDAGAEYVAVVTQDTAVERGWLAALVDVAETRPRAGAVQPKILRRLADGRPVIHSRGNALHYLGVGYVNGDGEPDRPLAVTAIGYASGAGVLYRARALREVGTFDAAMFMYHEDTDLSWRLRLAGWQVILAPAAVMWHDYVFASGVEKFYFIERNRLANLATHYRWRTLLLLLPALLLFEVGIFAYALRGGWWGRRASVYGWFIRPTTWRYLRRKRRQVQSLRRVPDAEIARYLAGTIDFPHPGSWIVGLVLNPIVGAYWRLVRPLIRW